MNSQILKMSPFNNVFIFIFIFVVLGLIQPKIGGSYFTLLIIVYIFLSLISGYILTWFYKMVHGTN